MLDPKERETRLAYYDKLIVGYKKSLAEYYALGDAYIAGTEQNGLEDWQELEIVIAQDLAMLRRTQRLRAMVARWQDEDPF